MNTEAFDTQINRLRDAFGEKNFSNERVKIIWQTVKHFQDEWFVKIVTEGIATLPHSPLPAWFSEQASIERDRIWKTTKTSSVVADWNTGAVRCGRCSDSGVLLENGPMENLYAFKCNCPRGQNDPRRFSNKF